jgi:hypothetical protein
MLLHTNTGKIALLLCAVFIACGDDGTERLSTCPEARIVTDRMGIIRCAGPKKAEAEGANNAGKTGASSGDQRSSASANHASQADSESRNSAANGGSATPSNDSSAGKPAAESGAREPQPGASGAPASSSGAPSSVPSGGSWYCLQVMNACSCVMGSVASDSCDKPRPTCCVRVENDASVNTCVCYPEDSAECTGVKSDPATYPPVSECPPK